MHALTTSALSKETVTLQKPTNSPIIHCEEQQKGLYFTSETQVCSFAAATCSQAYLHMSFAAFSASLILERNLLSCLQPVTILVEEFEEQILSQPHSHHCGASVILNKPLEWLSSQQIYSSIQLLYLFIFCKEPWAVFRPIAASVFCSKLVQFKSQLLLSQHDETTYEIN